MNEGLTTHSIEQQSGHYMTTNWYVGDYDHRVFDNPSGRADAVVFDHLPSGWSGRAYDDRIVFRRHDCAISWEQCLSPFQKLMAIVDNGSL